MVVDETLRRRMETRLIAKILSFEIRTQLEITLSCGSMDKPILPRQACQSIKVHYHQCILTGWLTKPDCSLKSVPIIAV